jgi:hypothetical protein
MTAFDRNPKAQSAHIRYWPIADIHYAAFDVAIGAKADMPFCAADVCF